MRRMRVILLSLLLPLACAQDPAEAPATCVPGEQRACACPGGGPPGAQICAASGDLFGPCLGCGMADSTGAPQTSSGEPEATTTAAASSSSGEPATSEPAASSTTGEPDGDTGTTGAPFVPPPPPDGFDVVQQVALDHPDWLAGSCVETGGTNEFMFEVVRRLRQKDPRWGLNWKRGVVGDLSQDVVDYHYGAGEREGSTDVNIIDIITGHCGDDPQAGWIDVTQATLDANTVGMWTLAGQDL